MHGPKAFPCINYLQGEKQCIYNTSHVPDQLTVINSTNKVNGPPVSKNTVKTQDTVALLRNINAIKDKKLPITVVQTCNLNTVKAKE